MTDLEKRAKDLEELTHFQAEFVRLEVLPLIEILEAKDIKNATPTGSRAVRAFKVSCVKQYNKALSKAIDELKKIMQK